MRMFLGVSPSEMCRKHLLGNHVECHMIYGAMKKNKNLDGYQGLIQPELLELWHEALSNEMIKRGYKHNSPMVYFLIPSKYLDLKVDEEKSVLDLRQRCNECKAME